MRSKKIIFIVGPTAVGKTEVALLLAKKLEAEIISCDSMQVYQEINIASNKPSTKILKEIPHHLINTVSITKEFDVVSFRKKAVEAINKIHKKNKIPIIVGGSGLYMQVLLDGIFKGPKKNERLRQELEKEAQAKGEQVLYQRLQELDPRAAAKIHPHDRKRIIRALEVFLTARKPISELQKNRQGLWGKFDIKIFALNRDRQELYESIDKRVEWMFQDGLVGEIQGLLPKKWSRTAEGLLGIKDVKGYLKGEYDLERAKYLMKLNTRHYAKRQLTWFRKDKRIQWLMMDKENPVTKVVSIITSVILRSESDEESIKEILRFAQNDLVKEIKN